MVIRGDSKLLSGFLWLINGNPDNNLESLCIINDELERPWKEAVVA
jgi:hypothetical protein